jgi:hypothetical protein
MTGRFGKIGLTLVSLSLAGVASAEVPEGYSEQAEAFRAKHPEAVFSVSDMNLSGSPEILAVSGSDCTSGCPFSVMSMDAGAVKVVLEGEANAVTFVPTQGMTSLLTADHVTWAFNGAALYPFNDALQDGIAQSPSFSEVERLRTVKYFEASDRTHFERYTFNFRADEADEIGFVFMNTDPLEKVGQWGTPYVVMTSESEIIHEGVATEVPRIFPHGDEEGLTILDVHPSGFIIETFR